MLGGLTLGGDGAGDFPARRGCHRPRSSGILYPKRHGRLPPLDGDAEPAPPSRKRRSIPSFSEGISSPKGQASEDGKIRALCMIRGVRAAKAGPSWQDLRAVYSQTAVCRAFRMHGAHILPKPARFRMHGARILPRTGDFPVRGTFRDTWSAKLATDCRPGTHFASILPSASARERTVVKSCHGKALGNAPHEYIATASQAKSALGRNPATTGRWRTHFASILPTERHLRAGGPIALP